MNDDKKDTNTTNEDSGNKDSGKLPDTTNTSKTELNDDGTDTTVV